MIQLLWSTCSSASPPVWIRISSWYLIYIHLLPVGGHYPSSFCLKSHSAFTVAPFKYWKTPLWPCQRLPFSRLNNFNSVSLSSCQRCCSCFITFMALLWTQKRYLWYMYVFFLYMEKKKIQDFTLLFPCNLIECTVSPCWHHLKYNALNNKINMVRKKPAFCSFCHYYFQSWLYSSICLYYFSDILD